MQQHECYTILRLFGIAPDKVKLSLRLAKAAGCQGLQLMESGGEYAVLIRCTGETEQQARRDCQHWQNRLCEEFGDAVVGIDQQSLPQAAVQALQEAGLFAVAGSAESAKLLIKALGPEPKSERVFDFGNKTYADRTVAERIRQRTGENKHKSELGFAAWQAACAVHETGAQLALHCTPGHAVLCTGHRAWACPLPTGAEAEYRTKAMLDLARRYARGLQWPEGTLEFQPGSAQKEPDRARSLGRAAAAHSSPHGRGVRRVGLVLAVLAVVAVLGAAVHGVFGRTPLEPDSKGYGTADFDTAASAYLQTQRQKESDVSAWLALPGGQSQLVYAGNSEKENIARWAQDTAVSPGNSVIQLPQGSAPNADEVQQAVRDNPGFTLYRPGGVYRCKVFAVYYYDEADGFSPMQYEGLGEDEALREFAIGMKERSLVDTGVSVDWGDGFITLLLGENDTGAQLAVAGRLIRQGESAALTASAIQPAEAPLYTAAQYAAMGETAPDAATVYSVWANWYDTRNDPPPEVPEQTTPAGTDPALDIDLSKLDAQMNELLSKADSALKGLTDVAGSGSTVESDVGQGAAGSVGSTDISFNDALAGEEKKPDLDQDHSTEQKPDGDVNLDGSGQQGAPDQIQSAEGRTINVTMNGVAQTMDLTECLAMIAQNELGNNQPAEAYKAQAVAAHSWILSQGSYPSVSGVSPSSAVREAVSQVATVLVTYNGKVCFTPYCASVSYGTVNCKDVWGVDRPYLQAVESPYDKQYSRNWNTNGSTSGTARYSRETVRSRVQEKLGIDLSVIEDPNEWFKVLSTNAFGYVTQMQIGNEQSGQTTCSGRWFRENLLIYQSVDGRTLRSCAFTSQYNSELDCFVFDVYGYGHGVGMSQWGAIGYAYNGWSYDQILTHYYTGTELVSY